MSHSKEMILGGILGGVLAGSAAIFLTSKSGKKLQKDISKKCKECKNKIEDFVEELKEAPDDKDISEWSEKAKNVVDFIKEEAETIVDPESEDLRKGLFIGGILGGLVGAGTTALLTSHLRNQDVGYIAKNLGSNIHDWRKVVRTLASSVDTKINDPRNSEIIDDVLDIATAGFQLWKHIKK